MNIRNTYYRKNAL